MEATFNTQKCEEMVYQSASNPWEENQILVKMYLEIVDILDRTGSWRLDLPAKSDRVNT